VLPFEGDEIHQDVRPVSERLLQGSGVRAIDPDVLDSLRNRALASARNYHFPPAFAKAGNQRPSGLPAPAEKECPPPRHGVDDSTLIS